MSKIRVAVRVRPFLQNETGEPAVAMCGRSLRLFNKFTSERSEFNFDFCYWSIDDSNPSNPRATNAVLCEDIGKEALQCAVDGFNSCIFAYGTTGSGKSYSIRGEGDEPGLLPYLCKQLFLDVIAKDDKNKYSVRVSYFEIYNERVIDLLSGSQVPLKVMVLPSKNQDTVNVIVKDLEKRAVHSCKEMAQVLLQGAQRLSFNRTSLNDHASRSHSIFTIYLTKRDAGDQSRLSQINVVDLAGSEHVKQSGVVGGSLRETCHINTSLTTLSRVIEAINTNLQLDHQQPKRHVPYRDSKLTTILSPSLGGNSKTFMVAAISPTVSSYADTLRTLKFAEGVGHVINDTHVNCYVNDILDHLSRERQALQFVPRSIPRRYTNPLQLGLKSDEVASESEEEEEKYRQFIKFYKMMKESDIVRQYPKLVFLNHQQDLSGAFYKIIDEDGFALLGCCFYLSDDAEQVFMKVEGIDADACLNGQPVTGIKALQHGDRIFLDENHVFVLSHLNQSQKIDSSLLSWQAVVAEVAEAREKAAQMEFQQLQSLIDELDRHLHGARLDSVSDVIGLCHGSLFDGDDALPPSIMQDAVSAESSRAAAYFIPELRPGAVSPSEEVDTPTAWFPHALSPCSRGSPKANQLHRSFNALSPSSVMLSDDAHAPPALGSAGIIVTLEPKTHGGNQWTDDSSDAKAAMSSCRKASGSYTANFQRRRRASRGLLACLVGSRSSAPDFDITSPGSDSSVRHAPRTSHSWLPSDITNPLAVEAPMRGRHPSIDNSRRLSPGGSSISPKSVQHYIPSEVEFENRPSDIRHKEAGALLRMLRQSLCHDCWLQPAQQALHDSIKFLLACSPYRSPDDVMREFYRRRAAAIEAKLAQTCALQANLVPLTPVDLSDRRLIRDIQSCVTRCSPLLASLDIRLIVKKVERIDNIAATGRCLRRAQALHQPSAPSRMLFYGCQEQYVAQTIQRGVAAGEGGSGIACKVITTTPNAVAAFLCTRGPAMTYHNQIFLCTVFPGKPKKVKDTEPYENAPHGSHAFPWHDDEVRRSSDSVHIHEDSSTHADEHLFWNPDQVLPCYLITFEVKDLVAEMSEAEVARLEHERKVRKAEFTRLQQTNFRLQTEAIRMAEMKQEQRAVQTSLSSTKEEVAKLQATTQRQESIICSQQDLLRQHQHIALETQHRLAFISEEQQKWQQLETSFQKTILALAEKQRKATLAVVEDLQMQQDSLHQQVLRQKEAQQQREETLAVLGQQLQETERLCERLAFEKESLESTIEMREGHLRQQMKSQAMQMANENTAEFQRLQVECDNAKMRLQELLRDREHVEAELKAAQQERSNMQQQVEDLSYLQRHVQELMADLQWEKQKVHQLVIENAELKRMAEVERTPPPVTFSVARSGRKGMEAVELHLELEEVAALESLSESDSGCSKRHKDLSSDTGDKGVTRSETPSDMQSQVSHKGPQDMEVVPFRARKKQGHPCCTVM